MDISNSPNKEVFPTGVKINSEDVPEQPLQESSKSTNLKQVPSPLNLASMNNLSDDDSESDDDVDVDAVFKVLVCGNARCGKTSVIRRYTHGTFFEHYTSTIGADFEEKEVDYDNQTRAALQLWDIAGQDRFAKLTRAYFREAKGAIVVCDITRENTFEAVRNWKKEIDACCVDMNDGCSIPVILIANKSDLLQDPEEALSTGARLKDCVNEYGFSGWYITSAKRGKEIDNAISFLLQKMMENYRDVKPTTPRSDTIRLSMPKIDTKKGKNKKEFFDDANCACN